MTVLVIIHHPFSFSLSFFAYLYIFFLFTHFERLKLDSFEKTELEPVDFRSASQFLKVKHTMTLVFHDLAESFFCFAL